MSHREQRNFCQLIKSRYPEYFVDKFVLDIGSLDVNGNNKGLFENCTYLGVDVAEGKNVDFVSLAHELEYPDESFDTIISTECLEHDMYWAMTLRNAMRMLKSGGLLVFTCATTGRAEHGTLRSDGGFSSPLTAKIPGWDNYYRNLDRADIEGAIDMEQFSEFEFSGNYTAPAFDLYFTGIKK